MSLAGPPVLRGRTLKPLFGIKLSWSKNTSELLRGAIIVRATESMTPEKLLELQMSVSRLFPWCGRRRAEFSVSRCCRGTTADKRLRSISTAMWLDILRARMAGRLFCGREVRGYTILAFCLAAIPVQLAASMTWMKLPEYLRAKPVRGQFCGRNTAMCAILGLYWEIHQARLRQLTIMVT